MANEQNIEALERAKKLVEEKISEMELSLNHAKETARRQLQEIEQALLNAKNIQSDTREEAFVSATKNQVTEPVLSQKTETKKVEPQKNIQKKTETKKPVANKEKEKFEILEKALKNRTKGKYPVEAGNSGVKHTDSEVFIYVIDDNALQLKVMLEKFKNTKSFKIAKGFQSGKECLDYIINHSFPKKSMIMVVVDYYLENNPDPEEAVTGIDVLNQLKEYDPDIEVIILSGSDDVDIAASATHFGAISFVKKGEDDFKKIVNNMVWSIHEKQKIRKKLETKKMVKNLGIGMAVAFLIIMALYYGGILEILRRM